MVRKMAEKKDNEIQSVEFEQNKDEELDFIDGNQSEDSSTFEMGEDNLFLSLNQARKVLVPVPPAMNPKMFYSDLGPLIPKSVNENEPVKALVVIFRDSDSRKDANDNIYNPSKALKVKLKQNKIGSYYITLPVMMEDLQAVQVMKGCKPINPGETPINKKSVSEEYMRLVFAIVDHKMSTKKRKIIIVDLGDESTIQLLALKDFCLRCNAEVHTLNLQPNDSIDVKLNQLTKKLVKRLQKLEWIKNNVSQISDVETKEDTKAKAKCRFHRPRSPRRVPLELNLGFNDALGLNVDAEVALAPPRPLSIQSRPCSARSSSWTMDSETDSVPTPPEVMTDRADYHINDLALAGFRGGIDTTTLPPPLPLIPSVESLPFSHETSELSSNKVDEKVSYLNLPENSNDRKKKLRKRSSTDPRYQREKEQRSKSSSDSEQSARVTQLCARSRPRLLKIQIMPDDKKSKPASISKFPPLSRTPSCIDEEYLYKGWVAVPASKEDIRRQKRRLEGRSERTLASTMRGIGQVIYTRLLKPIGRTVVACDCCKSKLKGKKVQPVPDYPEILRNSSAFEQKKDINDNNEIDE